MAMSPRRYLRLSLGEPNGVPDTSCSAIDRRRFGNRVRVMHVRSRLERVRRGSGQAQGTRVEAVYRQLLAGYHRAVARAALPTLDLHGPHDLRHTFATWLEDGGIPARVIDALMGHPAGSARARGLQDGSAIGQRYRHLAPQMQVRVLAVLDRCLATAETSMTQSCQGRPHPDRTTHGQHAKNGTDLR